VSRSLSRYRDYSILAGIVSYVLNYIVYPVLSELSPVWVYAARCGSSASNRWILQGKKPFNMIVYALNSVVYLGHVLMASRQSVALSYLVLVCPILSSGFRPVRSVAKTGRKRPCDLSPISHNWPSVEVSQCCGCTICNHNLTFEIAAAVAIPNLDRSYAVRLTVQESDNHRSAETKVRHLPYEK
jgi:hypothetical protein